MFSTIIPIPDAEIISKMKSFLILLTSTFCLANARMFVRDNATISSPATLKSNSTRYAILDNDWSPTAFIPYLLALGAGMEVLALASDTADTWVDQTTLHGVSPPLCSMCIRQKIKHLTNNSAGNT